MDCLVLRLTTSPYRAYDDGQLCLAIDAAPMLAYARMPLSRQDCVELIRDIEGLLGEYDSGSLDLAIRAMEPYDDPRRYLVELLRTISRIYSERSGGMHGPILDRINHFVRLEDGSPVRGLSVVLSPAEQELYGVREVNLAELPDRSQFLAELDRIIDDIMRETKPPENLR